VDIDVVIFNWACWGLVAADLTLTLTVARHTRWGRPGMRWLVAGTLIGVSANLVNLYAHARWAPLLFILTVPFLIMGSVSAARSAGLPGRREADSPAEIG
jgi:hypothetical protein